MLLAWGLSVGKKILKERADQGWVHMGSPVVQWQERTIWKGGGCRKRLAGDKQILPEFPAPPPNPGRVL